MDDLDRILGSEERLEPSSGLADSIMEAVREEAHAPAPLAFPWLRLVPGIAVSVALLVAGTVMVLSHGIPESAAITPEQAMEWLRSEPVYPWALLVLSLAVSWFAWKLPTKLAARLG